MTDASIMTLPRQSQIWLPGYIKDRLSTLARPPARRLWLAFADHYEPLWNGADEHKGAERVARWAIRWPAIAAKFQDSTGQPPRYTFFYPEEEYRPRLLEPLARMASDGIADVEVHLHHDGEGQQDFVDRISSFTETLFSRHGLLRKVKGKLTFGFIHGLWALDNSRPDGRFCGLNNELSLLRDLGCYADFTMPSGASPTQASLINTIYWAVDDPHKPKSYDTGIPVIPGSTTTGDLLMIPGPFGLRWAQRLLPRIEHSELCSYDPATEYRVRRWLELAPRIGADIFLKLFSHGTQERHSQYLLEGGLDFTLSLITQECQRVGLDLHFSTAWEMRQAVDAAVRGNAPFLREQVDAGVGEQQAVVLSQLAVCSSPANISWFQARRCSRIAEQRRVAATEAEFIESDIPNQIENEGRLRESKHEFTNAVEGSASSGARARTESSHPRFPPNLRRSPL